MGPFKKNGVTAVARNKARRSCNNRDCLVIPGPRCKTMKQGKNSESASCADGMEAVRENLFLIP